MWYATEQNVHVECIVKQTAAGSWNTAGIGIAWGEPKLDTTTDRDNDHAIVLVGSTWNGDYSSNNHHIRVGATNYSDVMVFNREYKLEVDRIGNTFECKCTDLTTGKIISKTYTYTGTNILDKWCFYQWEGSSFYVKDILISPI